MGRKSFGMTLVELLIAVVISGILIAVSSATIMTAMRLFYGSRESSALDVDLSAANTYAARQIQKASFYKLPNSETLQLFEYDESNPDPTVPKWVFSNTTRNGKQCVVLTDTNLTLSSADDKEIQVFENVHTTFSNPYGKDIERPTHVKIEFTSPRYTAPVTVFYTCGRVPPSVVWTISIKADDNGDIFKDLELHGLKVANGYTAVFGSTNNDRGLLSFFDSKGDKKNVFTYKWVRGSATNVPIDLYTWNPVPDGAGGFKSYSYIGGTIKEGGGQAGPALFVAKIDYGFTGSGTQVLGGTGEISAARVITDTPAFRNPTGTNFGQPRERTLISDIIETSTTTVLVAGQVYETEPQAFIADNVDISSTGPITMALTKLEPDPPPSGSASGIGWRDNASCPGYMPKPPKFFSASPTSTTHFLVYNTGGSGTSNTAICPVSNGLPGTPVIRGSGFEYWQDGVAYSYTPQGGDPTEDVVITSQSVADSLTEIKSYGNVGALSATYAFNNYIPPESRKYRGLAINTANVTEMTAVASFERKEDGQTVTTPFLVNFSTADTANPSSCGPVFGPPGYSLGASIDMSVVPGSIYTHFVQKGTLNGSPYWLIGKVQGTDMAHARRMEKIPPAANNGIFYRGYLEIHDEPDTYFS